MRLLSRLNSVPNQPPLGSDTRLVQSAAVPPPSVVYWAEFVGRQQVHNQGILAASEADPVRPSGRSQNNISRPGGASVVAPADDAFFGGIIEAGNDHVFGTQSFHAKPVIRKTQVQDFLPMRAAISCFPYLTGLGGSIANQRVQKRDVVDDRSRGEWPGASTD